MKQKFKHWLSVAVTVARRYLALDMTVYAGSATLFLLTASFPLLMWVLVIVNSVPGFSVEGVAELLARNDIEVVTSAYCEIPEAGRIDVTPGEPQTAPMIAARVERALARIDKRRITLNPDCGFAPGSAAKVDTDEVYLKLKAEADAASLLRAKYS